MKAIEKLLPGQPGTGKLLEQYGDDLLCVRYRYDPENHIKVKTIEIVIERSRCNGTRKRAPERRIVTIRIDYGELELGGRVKYAGGYRERRVWEIAYEDVVTLGLEDRIVSEQGGQMSPLLEK